MKRMLILFLSMSLISVCGSEDSGDTPPKKQSINLEEIQEKGEELLFNVFNGARDFYFDSEKEAWREDRLKLTAAFVAGFIVRGKIRYWRPFSKHGADQQKNSRKNVIIQ